VNDTQEWLGLSEAARQLPAINGRRIHPSSLWRWARKGIAGERLEHGKLGGRIVVTMDGIRQFAERLAEVDIPAAGPKLPEEPKPRTTKQRERDVARAEAELAEAGI